MIAPDPVPIEVAARGWQAVMDPDSGHWQLQAAVRTLSAAARSSPKPLARDLATAVGIVMDRASKVNPLEAPGSIHLPAPILDSADECAKMLRCCNEQSFLFC